MFKVDETPELYRISITPTKGFDIPKNKIEGSMADVLGAIECIVGDDEILWHTSLYIDIADELIFRKKRS